MSQCLIVENLNKYFNGIKALDDFSCQIEPGKLIGLIGPNGAGKTTFFNVLGGILTADSGSVRFGDKELVGKSSHRIAQYGISRTFQNLRLIRQILVIENVLLAFRHQNGERLSSLLVRWNIVRNQELNNHKKALQILERFELHNKAYKLADELSYGQQKLLTLACCIAAEATLLLLDEPLAGLSPPMIGIVLEILREQHSVGKTILVIEHNIEVILDDFNHVIFMDNGRKICEGLPDKVRSDPRVIEAYLR